MIRRLLSYTLIAPLLLAASCISEEATDCPDKKENTMTLSFKLDMGLDATSAGTQSRAGSEAPDGFTGSAARKFEKISTLRVIILRGTDRKVEGARLVATNDDGAPIKDDLEFDSIASNETKTILLIANEDALPAPAGSGYQTTRAYLDQFMVKGTKITNDQWNQLLDWTVSMPESTDATSTRGLFTDADGNYPAYGLPLTELFRVYASTALASIPTSEIYTQEVVLFLTRAAAKARFHFYVDENPQQNPYLGKGMYVTGIRINGIDLTEYVFPKDTYYSPEKYLRDNAEGPIPNVVDNAERYITSFTPVSNTKKDDFTLDISANPVEVKSYNADIPMRGPIYFPESMCATGQNYTVQVRVGTKEGDRWIYGENDGWITAKDNGKLKDNILNVDGRDAIARNTCLDINIFFGEPGITWNVSVVPYIGVTLNPSFGEILDRNNQN